jgi:site-specific recombinase XerD
MARETTKVFETNPKDVESILPENKELMEDFLNYMETTDHAKTSITVYKNNLEIFFVYLLKHCKNKDFVDIKKRDIMNFQSYMVKNGLSSARIKNIKSTLSSCSTFIEDILDEEEKWEGFRNIINKIKPPNANPVREKTILPDEKCQELLDYLVENKKYQQACAFALAWASGRRKSELLRIKRTYISEENLKYGSLYKTPEKIKTKGAGLAGKPLFVWILKTKFKKYFDLWMEERERLGVPDDIDSIFVNKRNGIWQPAKISLLDSWAEKFTDFLGVDYYWHCMRHNFCTSLALAKIPDAIIQDIIGWSSSDMLKIYKDIEVDDQLGEYFGEDGIKENIKSGSLDKL